MYKNEPKRPVGAFLFLSDRSNSTRKRLSVQRIFLFSSASSSSSSSIYNGTWDSVLIGICKRAVVVQRRQRRRPQTTVAINTNDIKRISRFLLRLLLLFTSSKYFTRLNNFVKKKEENTQTSHDTFQSLTMCDQERISRDSPFKFKPRSCLFSNRLFINDSPRGTS